MAVSLPSPLENLVKEPPEVQLSIVKAELNAQEEALKALNRNYETLSRIQSRSKEEIDTLRMQLNLSKGQTADIAKRLKSSEDENRELRARLTGMDKKEMECSKLHEQLEESLKVSKLATERARIANERAQEAMDTAEASQQETKAVQIRFTQREIKSSELDEAKQRAMEAERSLQTLQEELKVARGHNVSLAGEMEKLEAKIVPTESLLKKSQQCERQLRMEVAGLRGELRRSRANSETSAAEMMRKEKDASNQQEEIAQLKDQLEESKAREIEQAAQTSNVTDRLHQSQNEREQLHVALETARSMVDKLSVELLSIPRLEGKLAEADKAAALLRGEIDGLNNQIREANVEFESKLDTCRDEIELKDRDHERLREEALNWAEKAKKALNIRESQEKIAVRIDEAGAAFSARAFELDTKWATLSYSLDDAVATSISSGMELKRRLVAIEKELASTGTGIDALTRKVNLDVAQRVEQDLRATAPLEKDMKEMGARLEEADEARRKVELMLSESERKRTHAETIVSDIKQQLERIASSREAEIDEATRSARNAVQELCKVVKKSCKSCDAIAGDVRDVVSLMRRHKVKEFCNDGRTEDEYDSHGIPDGNESMAIGECLHSKLQSLRIIFAAFTSKARGNKTPADIHLREKELKKSLDMLSKSEESVESAVSCMSCMGLLREPVTMTHCGHNVCLECAEKVPGFCPECKSEGRWSEIPYIANPALDIIASKQDYRRSILNALQNLCET